MIYNNGVVGVGMEMRENVTGDFNQQAVFQSLFNLRNQCRMSDSFY